MLSIRALSTDLIGPAELELPAGRIAVLMGESGAGKSLLLRAIADLDPNRGAVILDQKPRETFTATAWRRRVAYVPAEPGWWATRVGTHFMPDPDPSPWLDRLGLAGALDWEVARASTGERQRLALVRALQTDPQVLLLDEPTAALDARATVVVEDLIRDLAGQGAAVLVVSHDAEQAARLGDIRLSLQGGQVKVAA